MRVGKGWGGSHMSVGGSLGLGVGGVATGGVARRYKISLGVKQ